MRLGSSASSEAARFMVSANTAAALANLSVWGVGSPRPLLFQFQNPDWFNVGTLPQDSLFVMTTRSPRGPFLQGSSKKSNVGNEVPTRRLTPVGLNVFGEEGGPPSTLPQHQPIVVNRSNQMQTAADSSVSESRLTFSIRASVSSSDPVLERTLASPQDDGEENDPTSLMFLDSFDDEFQKDVQEAWTRLDLNGDGVIDADELRTGLVGLGLKDSYMDTEFISQHSQQGIHFNEFMDIVRVQYGCALLAKHFEQHKRKLRLPSRLAYVDYSKGGISWHMDHCERDYCTHCNESRMDFLFQRPLQNVKGTCSACGRLFDGTVDAFCRQCGAKQKVLTGPGSQGLGRVTRWINVEGLDPLLVRQLALRYKLDPFAIEDALQEEQRPKMDEYDHGVFVVAPMLTMTGEKVPGGDEAHGVADETTTGRRISLSRSITGLGGGSSAQRVGIHRSESEFDPKTLSIQVEAVSIFVVDAERTVITIQPKKGDVWDGLRRNMKPSWSRVRREDHHFLLYSLLDLMTDGLFPVLKEVLMCNDRLQEQLQSADPLDPKINGFEIESVLNIKKQLLFMHRVLRPMRAVLEKAKDKAKDKENASFSATSAKYFLDVNSHMVQIIEDIDEGLAECRGAILKCSVTSQNAKFHVFGRV